MRSVKTRRLPLPQPWKGTAAGGDARRRCKNAGNCLHNEFRLWLGHRRQQPGQTRPVRRKQGGGGNGGEHERKELSEARAPNVMGRCKVRHKICWDYGKYQCAT